MIPKQTIDELLKEGKEHDCTGERFGGVCVKIVAVAKLPTRFGDFQIIAFYNDKDKKEHTAIVKGDPCGKKGIAVRLHSECLTGDAIGSLRCDCRDQLITSLQSIQKRGEGIVLYLRQEGRGIGFINKIRAYALQDRGFDTIEANKMLGFQADERDYDIAAHMLSTLNVESVKLMTNNPDKIEDLKSHNVKVVDRIPVVIPANKFNRFYLETKRKKAGHLLERQESEKRLEQEEKIIVKE